VSTDNTPQLRVVCAALRDGQGRIIAGPRHFDQVMHEQIKARAYPGTWKRAEQGFLDQFGAFLSREEAWQVAFDAGQILRRVGGDGERLYSENLY
jgi:hypothetical protein